MKRLFLLLFTHIIILLPARSDEGMWIPMLIEKYNIRIMQEKGFKLEAEDIYSINKACMKDAVLRFGGGCTGEMISGKGLLITNHHCGFSQIQRHSSLEHDYITNGFWAMSAAEELPNPGLSVTFLRRMEDVTDKVLEGVNDGMSASSREETISKNIASISLEAVKGTRYSAYVRPFFMGNQYFLFVNETFTDVRLVGAPPSAIGNFGGDTDNWIWPRHTGDFSMFRVYAGKDNKPADYSPGNIPYQPMHFFPVSLKGVNEGDFTMVFGYPGTTNQYVPSFYIDMVRNKINPRAIELRTRKIEIIDEAMNADPLVRIQYSSKKVGISNSWKRWIGEIQGLDRMMTIEKKKQYETRINEWINADQARKSEYGDLLARYEELYKALGDYNLVNTITNDAFFSTGAEAVAFSRGIASLLSLLETGADEESISGAKERLLSSAESFFRNYNAPTDKKLFIAMMEMYGKHLGDEWQAQVYKDVVNSCDGNFSELADKIYRQSVFTDQQRFNEFVSSMTVRDVKKVRSDVLFNLSEGLSAFINEKVRGELGRINSEIQELNRRYMRAQMEYESGKLFYPDANSTLRVSYGNIAGYNSEDAVYFRHYTTLKGIMEKDNPDIYDYAVPDKLKQLYRERDFGRYVQNGEVPVCFIANNHTTGGNSGSPVINAEGHLIGINFDRAWEGVASDMAFNPEQSRNISLDIRYALFIIDKFAGAGYLLEEMTIVE